MILNEIMRKKGPREERVIRAMTDYIVERFMYDAHESFCSVDVPGDYASHFFGGTTKEEWIRFRLQEQQLMSYIGEPLDDAVEGAWKKLSQKYKPLSDEEREDMTREQGI